MLKIVSILILSFLLASCAGIRFCNKEESPKTGCKPWDPATTTGAASR